MRFAILTLTEDRFVQDYLSNLIEEDKQLHKDDFHFVEVCQTGSAEELKILKKNKQNIIASLEELNAQCVVTIGAELTKLVLGNVALSKVTSKIIPVSDRLSVLPCYDPKATTYDSKVKEAIPLVFSALKLKFISDAITQRPNITKLDSEAKIKDAIDHLSKVPLVGFDLETTSDGIDRGLSPFNKGARILTAAFSSETEAYWIDVNYTDQLNQNMWFMAILNSVKDKLVIHNRPFDVLFTKALTGLFLDNTHDSMLVQFLVDENQPLGLKALAFKILGWVDYADDVKSVVKETRDFATVDLEELGTYNALDAASCLHVYNEGVKKLPDKNLYEFLRKIQNMYVVASLNGFPIDLEYIAEYKSKILAERDKMLTDIYQFPEVEEAKKIVRELENDGLDKELFLSTGRVKYVKRTKSSLEPVEYDIMKPRHLLALLSIIDKIPEERTPKGGISLAASTLEEIDHPIIQNLSRIKTISTIANTFITGFLKKVRMDGKVHPNFTLTRTVTGRTACSDPSVQQIPRDKEVKNFFYVPEGYKLVQFDFAQAEIRVIASFANDRNLIEAILKGSDMHKEVASFMYQKPVEEITKEERQAAKALNFGVVYGMGPMALARHLKVDQSEAEDKLARYMNQFSGVKKWIEATHRYALKNHQVVTPFGRLRHLPEVGLPDKGAVSGALRQAQNAPVQATASDLTLWLLLKVFESMDSSKAHFLASVHDSGVYAVKDDYVNGFIKLLNDKLNQLNETFTFLKVPMKLDVSVAELDETLKSRWGNMQEVCALNGGEIQWTQVE